MAAHQTRRSISVRSTTEARLKLCAKDLGLSTSGLLEHVIAGKLGEASDDEITVYEAHEKERGKQSQKKPKIGPEDSTPDTDQEQPARERPRHMQPSPVPKEQAQEKAADEPVPDEMKDYIDPHLLL